MAPAVGTASAWTETEPGQALLAAESPALDEVVRRMHGDLLVWSGVSARSAASMRRCMVRRRLYLSCLPQDCHRWRGTRQASATLPVGVSVAAARPEALPLADASVDGLVLHHSLEQARDLRMALREAGRVVAPGGRLALCVFNQMSPLGLRRLAGRRHAFADLKFINPLRLFDWLALLGFQTEAKPLYLTYCLPRVRKRRDWPWLRRLNPPFGNILILVAARRRTGRQFIGYATRLPRHESGAPVSVGRFRPVQSVARILR